MFHQPVESGLGIIEIGSAPRDRRRRSRAQSTEIAHIREHHTVACRDPRRIRKTVLQVSHERMFGVGGLFERVLDPMAGTGAVDAEPSTPVELDSPTLHLENNQPIRRMEEREVGFPVTLSTVSNRLPAHRMEHPPRVGETGKCVIDAALGVRCPGRNSIGDYKRHDWRLRG